MIRESKSEIQRNWKRFKNTLDYINNQKVGNPVLPIKLAVPSLVLEAIEKWRQYDFRNRVIAEILREVKKFLCSVGTLACSKKIISPPFQLWRIRRGDKELLKDENEFWEPKCRDAKTSRCNIEGEPMLYTSILKTTPFDELNIKDGETIFLIEYETIDNLNLIYPYATEFHPVHNGKEIYDEMSLLSYQIIREFLRSEFIKPVGEGMEYLYKISASFSKIALLYNEEIDGIIYPSIQSPDEYNIAILKKARCKLRIQNINASKITKDKEQLIEYKGNITQDKVNWIRQS